jgi:FtsP/CotA-like multicopper oxidase with cupredoxin domain
MTVKRVLILLGSVLLLCCGGGIAIVTLAVRALDTSDRVAWTNPMAVPPLAPSRVDGQGRRIFDLDARVGRHAFGATTVATQGYNGDYLGPTLRATRGETVIVNVRNGLDETTTLHWHGMHLPAMMDGGPHQPIAPGQTWSPTWRIEQPAATLWYHPHPHGETADQVYRGLAGLFLVDDHEPVDLPRAYGVDDFPVIVQDKQFDGDELDTSRVFLGDIGILGDTIAVNGTVGPYLDVTTERVRLRLLNASNARTYGFGFTDDREFSQIATDGGLLPAPQATRRLNLSPGERAEIVVTVRPGERSVLRSFPPKLGLDPLSDRFSGSADTLDILQVRAASTLAPSPAVPATLARETAPSKEIRTRDFRMGDKQINGERMDMSRVDVTVEKGTTELWRVVNNDGSPHNFHVHGVSFRVRGQPGWKDTVFLRPQERYELIVPFGDYADPTTPYMFHCHVLYHEDQGMMGQFVVVNPGQTAGHPGHVS